MFLVPIPPVIVPDPVVTERTTYYTIEGAREPDWVREMNDKGPIDSTGNYWGYSHDSMSWSYSTDQVGDRCVLKDPKITLGVNIILPEWKPPAGASPKVIEKWRNLAEAMTRHEGEHANNARDAANETVALMRAHPSDASCKKLSAYLREKGAEIARRKNDANVELDARTRHGALEGVTLSW